MESFVERIIETDRKAREMIEAAQQKKQTLQKEAEEKAQQTLTARAAADKTAIEKLDSALALQETAAMDKADKEYIQAKHVLDDAFNAGRDGWLSELTKACITVE